MHSINSTKYSIQYIEIPHYLQLFANIPVNFNAWYSNTIKDSIQFIQTSNNMAGQYGNTNLCNQIIKFTFYFGWEWCS